MAHWTRQRTPGNAPPFPIYEYDARPGLHRPRSLTQRQTYRTTRTRLSMVLPIIVLLALIVIAGLHWIGSSSGSSHPEMDPSQQDTSSIDDTKDLSSIPGVEQSKLRSGQVYIAGE
jgi:hypothetical protein